MAKQKTIKLKAAERKEADALHRDITIADHGIAVAQRMSFEAGERLWEYLRVLYPNIPRRARYIKGVLTWREEDKS